MGAINFNPSSLDGITTILAFLFGGLFILGIFFAVIFNAWSKSKWKKRKRSLFFANVFEREDA